MNLDQISNYFMLSGEIIVGFLAFQGIAATFVFVRKGNWTFLDLWTFAWMIINNLCALFVCILPVFLLIDHAENDLYWEINFYISFGLLFCFTLLFIYFQTQMKARQKVDKTTQLEMSSSVQQAFDKVYILLIFLPFLLPLFHYLGYIGPTFVRNWVCLSPWIWSSVSFSNFYLLIYNAIRVVD